MSTTPTTSIGGYVTFAIGSGEDITLTTNDLTDAPVVYQQPENQPLSVPITDITAFLQNSFDFAFTLPDFIKNIMVGNTLTINNFLLSTSKDFNIELAVTFDPTKPGIIPGITFKEIGVSVNRTETPAILNMPATVSVGTSLKIGGTGILKAKTVSAGTSQNTMLPLGAVTVIDNFHLSVIIPATFAPAAKENIYITLSDGTPVIVSTATINILAA